MHLYVLFGFSGFSFFGAGRLVFVVLEFFFNAAIIFALTGESLFQ